MQPGNATSETPPSKSGTNPAGFAAANHGRTLSRNGVTPFERCVAAEVMGVGLGVDIFDDQPDFRVLAREFPRGFDFLEVYSRGDWEHTDGPFSEIPDWVRRTYHHEGLDPTGPALCPDDRIDGCVKNVGLLSPPWSVEELAVRHIDGKYCDFFFPAVLTEDCLKCTVENLRALQERIPVPILPEIAPYEFVVGDLHVLDFLREVSHRSGMGVVLDLGHLFSYQLCVGRGESPLDGIARMDLDRVIEVHLAGARIDRVGDGSLIYRDLHGAGPILPEALGMLETLLPKLTNLRAITVEVETASEAKAVSQVEQVKDVVRRVRPEFLAAAGRNARPGTPAATEHRAKGGRR